MGPNVLVFAWNRSVPGREALSGAHFQEFMQYLAEQKGKGAIDDFEPVFLDPHGGTFNGFVLIRGDAAKLERFAGSPEWDRHVTRAILHLDGASVLRGVTGNALQERMALWLGLLPKG